MAADNTYTFGSMLRVTDRADLMWSATKWLEGQVEKYIGFNACEYTPIRGAGKLNFYHKTFAFDADGANKTMVRMPGAQLPMADPAMAYTVDVTPYVRGLATTIDETDPNVRAQGQAQAEFAAAQLTLTKCLEAVDRHFIEVVLASSTPFGTADTDGSGGVWSTAASDIPAQLNSMITSHGYTLRNCAMQFGHYHEMLINTALVGQFGGLSGVGRLSEQQGQAALGAWGVDNLYVFRSEFNSLVADVSFWEDGAVKICVVPHATSDERGIFMSQEPVPQTAGMTQQLFAGVECEIVVDPDAGARLADV